jgi:polyhydroxybutyrate depolymerase
MRAMTRSKPSLRRARLAHAPFALATCAVLGCGSATPALDSGTRTDGAASDSGSSAPVDGARPSDASARDATTSGARSAGCGRAETASGAFELRTIDVGAIERSYHLKIPATYDRERAYPVVFRFHGDGGDGLDGALGIEWPAGENAIIVGGNGIDRSWASESDLPFFDAMLAEISGRYCVALDRVFSYGFSSGGGMTNRLACVRGDVVRGAAAVAGFDSTAGATCIGTPAVWLLHDEDDLGVPIDNGIAVRDRAIARSHCASTTTPVPGRAPCVAYDACDAPVIWCQTSGIGHNPQGDFAIPAVWEFIESLR